MPKSNGGDRGQGTGDRGQLVGVARAMATYAAHFPGAVARPEKPLRGGARIALTLVGDEFRLRIGRYGRAPSDLRGLAAWEREVVVFRAAFDVPHNAVTERGEQDGFYYVIVAWRAVEQVRLGV